MSKLKWDELYVGYDIGITSVGWALIGKDGDKYNLIEDGSVLFDEAVEASEARISRSARRNRRRKTWRLDQLKDAFDDFGVIKKSELALKGYTNFSATHKTNKDGELGLDKSLEVIDFNKFPTIYHLRQYALKNKVSKRELFLCLQNIVKTRGHFLLDGKVDFLSGNNVDKELIVEDICNILIANFGLEDNQELKDIISNRVECILKKEKVAGIKDFDDIENNICNFVLKFVQDKGFKKEFNHILDARYADIDLDESFNKFKVSEIYKKGQLAIVVPETFTSIFDNLYNIYNNINLLLQLKDDYITQGKPIHYICQLDALSHDMVVELNKIVREQLKDSSSVKLSNVVEQYLFEHGYNTDEDNIEEFIKKEINSRIKYNKTTVKNTFSEKDIKPFKADTEISDILPLDSIKNNVTHNFPNGLYVKEALDILQAQEITDKEFINVIKEVVSAKIPYYMGPITNNREQSKNSWLEYANDEPKKIKYSYNYMKEKGLFDEEKSIKNWKNAMISHCTYLPDEFALPKESFIMQIFSILNELNNFKVKDEDERTLTKDEKIKVLNEIFLNEKYKGKTIKCSDVEELLNIKNYGSKKGNYDSFNNKLTLYFDIVKVAPHLKIVDIEKEVISDRTKDKLNTIEEIILNLNLLDDTTNKFNEFMDESKNYNLTETQANVLSNLNTTKFSSISRKLILDYNIEIDGESKTMLEWLLESDKEQMGILTASNLSTDKYTRLLDSNGHKLDLSLLVENGKSRLPISRTVLKALNVCMKVHNKITQLYGIPNKVVLETTRELKDFSEQSVKCETRAKNNEKLLDVFAKNSKAKFKKRTEIYKTLNEEQDIYKAISDHTGDKKLQKKIELYIRQEGVDLISMKKMNIDDIVKHPDKYHFGHIIPRSYGDNSDNNMILITEDSNKQQGDRLPLEYFRAEANAQEQEFIKLVKRLYDYQVISKKKFNNLMLQSQDDAIGFVGQNLSDTRYIISEFSSILRAFHKDDDTIVTPIKAQLNSIYRRAFDFVKIRDFGPQHHAHDAALAIIINQIEKTRLKDAKKLAIGKVRHKDVAFDNIRSAYKQVFDEGCNDKHSLINEIKTRVPLYNKLVSKKYTGQLFDATVYEKISMVKDFENRNKRFSNVYSYVLKEKNEFTNDNLEKLSEVMSDVEYITQARILDTGIDSYPTHKEFSSFKSFCIDIYELQNKKGDKVFKNIFIPKIAIKNGEINKEQYKNIVENQSKDLIRDGEVDTSKFRIRIFRNNMFYNNNVPELLSVNGGSLANKKADIKHIPVRNYVAQKDSTEYVYQQLKPALKSFAKEYDVEFEEAWLSIIQLMRVLNDEECDKLKEHLMEFILGERKVGRLANLLKRSALNDFVSIVANEIVDSYEYNTFKYSPSTYQIKKVLNSIDGPNSGNFVKVMPNILGIRWEVEDNHLNISGPKNTINYEKPFVKKTREKFTYSVK